ncbi:MAG: ABC transporter permease [Alphaproteobacteria bacterium]|nr:ABC transporter permease [Alphaproteobacteria bacterium]
MNALPSQLYSPIMDMARGNRWTPFVSILCAGILWELVILYGGVNTLLMPPPSAVLVRLFEMLGPGEGAVPDFLMIRHIAWTMFALIVGFLAAAMVSSAIGLVMGMNRTVYAWLNPIISIFMVIPNIAVVPVLILWLGLGMHTVIVVVITGSCFPIIYTAAAGVQNVPTRMIWAAQTAGATRWQILTTVLLGATMPYLIAGHKLALGRAWRAVIAGEIFAATKYGVGFMIYDARTFLDTEAMFAGLIVVGLIGVSLERILFGFIERRTVEKWGVTTSKNL